MAGESTKGINDYTDEELAGLSTEELAQLRGDAGKAQGEEEETEEERAEREAAEARAAAATSSKDDELDPEAVARLAAEGDADTGSRMVPHSRFEEVNAERKLLLDEVIRLRSGGAAAAPAPAPAPPAYDFKAKRREYQALLLDDPDKAADLLDEIEAERDRLTEERIRAAEERGLKRATETFTQQRIKQDAETTAARLYEKFPFLNHESDKADVTAIYAVIGQRDAYIQSGLDPIAAMQRAAEEVGEKFAKILMPAAPPAPPAGEPTAVEKRRAEELRRAAEASGKQPPAVAGGIGNRAVDGKLDINNLTDEQLMKLSPEELAKLRGDNRLPA